MEALTFVRSTRPAWLEYYRAGCATKTVLQASLRFVSHLVVLLPDVWLVSLFIESPKNGSPV